MVAGNFVKTDNLAISSGSTSSAFVVAIFIGILALARLKKIPGFLSRKMVHIGMGILLVAFDSAISTSLIIALASTTLALLLLYPDLFATFSRGRFDSGIWTYCVCVVVAKSLDIPMIALGSFFWADPAACIAGRSASRFAPNSILARKLWAQKTVAGSGAFALVTFACLSVPQFWQSFTFGFRLCLTLILTISELTFVCNDNLPVGITLLLVASSTNAANHTITYLLMSSLISLALWYFIRLCCYNDRNAKTQS